MDYFEKPFWNQLQLIAWVYTGDRKLVAQVAYEAPKEAFEREVVLPDGRRVVVPETDGHDIYEIWVYASVNGRSTQKTWEAAQDEIDGALCTGRLSAYGVENDIGGLKPIDSYEWADMKLHFHRDIAGPEDLLRFGIKIWYGLKFRREQVLEVWPDPLASVGKQHAIEEAPEPLSDEADEKNGNDCIKPDGPNLPNDELLNPFDPIPLTGIAKMFPVDKDEKANDAKWRRFAQEASRNELNQSRVSVGRGSAESKFDPQRVGAWLAKKGEFSQANVTRILKHNLPERSKHLSEFYEC